MLNSGSALPSSGDWLIMTYILFYSILLSFLISVVMVEIKHGPPMVLQLIHKFSVYRIPGTLLTTTSNRKQNVTIMTINHQDRCADYSDLFTLNLPQIMDVLNKFSVMNQLLPQTFRGEVLQHTLKLKVSFTNNPLPTKIFSFQTNIQNTNTMKL